MRFNPPGLERRSSAARWIAAAMATTLAGLVLVYHASASSAAASKTTAAKISTTAGVATAKKDLKPYLTAPTKINVTTPLKVPAPKGKFIIFLGTTQTQNVVGQHAVNAAAKALGWKYALVSYDPANPATFKSALSTAISEHPNYIMEAGLPPSLITPDTAQLKAAGIKVVTVASYPGIQNKTIVYNTDGIQNVERSGKIDAWWIIAHSQGTANVLVVHVPEYAVLDGFTLGFHKEMSALCPKCVEQTQDITLSQLAAGQTNTLVTNALQRDSAAQYLAYDDAPWADGITQALSTAGLQKVLVTGEGADVDAVAALQAGTEAGWTAFNTQYAYYEGVDALIRATEGIPIPASDSFDPTEMLTKSNSAKAAAWGVPNELQQFVRLWKK